MKSHARSNEDSGMSRGLFNFAMDRTTSSAKSTQVQQPYQSQLVKSDPYGSQSILKKQVSSSFLKPKVELNIKSLSRKGSFNAYFTSNDSAQNSARERKVERCITPRSSSVERKLVPKDRARSTERTADPAYLISANRVNNVVSENLSFISRVTSTAESDSNSFIGNYPDKERLSQKSGLSQRSNNPQNILINNIFATRDDNQTPEGDLLTLIHYISDNGLKKEISRSELGINGNMSLISEV